MLAVNFWRLLDVGAQRVRDSLAHFCQKGLHSISTVSSDGVVFAPCILCCVPYADIMHSEGDFVWYNSWSLGHKVMTTVVGK